MKKLHIIAAAAAMLAFGLNPALAVMGIMEADTSAGKVLTDAKGMTLYTYDKDEAGKTSCYDKCAVNWPPFAAAADAVESGQSSASRCRTS